MSIKVGSDFSGVGAFEQALNHLGIKHEVVFACDKDKYARLTYVHNYGEPEYYPTDVYEREIPGDSLDIYMTSPPCQSFSLAGKRLGKDDKRGILFFNSHEFITKNEPRYFIFENVKGLLSDDGGKTFSEWLHLLGGKSVNGMPIVFPYDGAVPYHVYWKVLNAKDFGVPQNRERVFIIGIRDDVDNDFSFPKEVPLTKRLKDVLESEVDEKYYLSDKMIAGFLSKNERIGSDGSGFGFRPKEDDDISDCITARYYKQSASDVYVKGFINQDTQASQVFDTGGVSPNVCVGTHGYANGYIQETPQLKQVGSLYENNSDAGRIYDEDGISCTIKSEGGGLGAKTGLYEVADVITHNMMPSSSTSGKCGTGHLQRNDGIAYCLDTGNTNAVETLVLNDTKHSQQRIYNTEGISPSILSGSNGGGQSPVKHLTTTKRIRKLTPRECFRLMDFPDTFDFSVVSNSQAYRQAGNSIVVAVLAAIINKLKL